MGIPPFVGGQAPTGLAAVWLMRRDGMTIVMDRMRDLEGMVGTCNCSYGCCDISRIFVYTRLEYTMGYLVVGIAHYIKSNDRGRGIFIFRDHV